MKLCLLLLSYVILTVSFIFFHQRRTYRRSISFFARNNRDYHGSIIALPSATVLPMSSAEFNLPRWTYNRYPKDFIVIEDHALENFDKSFETTSTAMTTTFPREENNQTSTMIPSFLTEEQLILIQNLSNGSIITTNSLGTILPLTFPHGLTKSQRTTFHYFIRREYPSLDTETGISSNITAPETIIYLIKRNRSSKKILHPTDIKTNPSLSNSTDSSGSDDVDGINAIGRRIKLPKKRWNTELQQNFLHFTGIKISLTTQEFIDHLSAQTGLSNSRFKYCGNKDSNAITFQRFSAWRTSKEILLKGNQIRSTHPYYHRKILKVKGDYLLRDIAHSNNPMKLSNLRGNLFIITLRSAVPLPVDETIRIRKDIRQSFVNNCQQDKGKGFNYFPNYFGYQRFGTPLSVNPSVAKYLLQHDYRSAVMILLLAPSSKFEVELGNVSMSTVLRWIDRANQMSRFTVVDSNEAYFDSIRKEYTDYAQKMEALVQERLDENYLSSNDEEPSRSEEETNTIGPSSSGNKTFFIKFVTRLQFFQDFLSGGTLLMQRKFPSLIGFSQKKLLQTIQAQLVNNNASSTSFLSSPEGSTVPPSFDVENNSSLNRIIPPSLHLESLNYHNLFQSSFSVELKTFFINSYQSLFFNKFVKYRLHNLSVTDLPENSQSFAKEDDLVLLDQDGNPLSNQDVYGRYLGNSSSGEDSSSVSNEDENKVVANLNANVIDLFPQSPFSSLPSSSSKKGANQTRFYVKVVSKQDEIEKKYTLFHVVAPLPGTRTYLNTSWIQSFLQQTQQQDHILLSSKELASSLCNTSSSFAFPGAYRHLLCFTSNLQLHQHGNLWLPTKELDNATSSSFSTLISEKFLDGTLNALLSRLFSLNSSIAVPDSLLQPFNQQQIPMQRHSEDSATTPMTCLPNSEIDGERRFDASDDDYLCRISFALPPSSYATVFLEYFNHYLQQQQQCLSSPSLTSLREKEQSNI